MDVLMWRQWNIDGDERNAKEVECVDVDDAGVGECGGCGGYVLEIEVELR